MCIPISTRREVCANGNAVSSAAMQACTMSLSALNASGMCCKTRPHCLATSRAKVLSFRSSSAAYLKASGSSSVASSTNSLSPRSPSSAPCMAEPRPLRAASMTRSRFPRSSSVAPPSAAPLRRMASWTKAGSRRSSMEASRSCSPSRTTAARTSSRSSRSSCVAWASAAPRLAPRTPMTRSRSPRASAGAVARSFQSCRTAVRQAARR
mmetsp:Transcript_4463/g.13085  ORF Transcript_4463/g.13085 Transcript_4463/m.13085 type:complete len:209 (-) Transcript_4463:756-1382(-)